MSDYEHMSVSDIEKLIADTSNILNKALSQYKETENHLQKTQEELNPVVEEYRRLDAQKKKQEAALKAIKPILDEHKEKLRHLKHWLTRAALRKLQDEEFEKLSAELDTLTANASWREFAFSHQISGAKRIALTGGKAILGDKRGLGKTLTSLIAMDMMKSRKIIIFAPKETIKNFEDEIKEWAPHRKLISMIGRPKEQRDFMLDSLPFTDEFILTMNLEAWRRDPYLIDKLIEIQSDTIVIDEAHFIKESKTTTAQGIQRVVHAQNMCALCGENSLKFDGQFMSCITKGCDAKYKPHDDNAKSVKHVIPMTGTPIMNSPVDMWVLLNLIDEASFKDKNEFCELYCQKNWRGKWVFRRPGGEAELLKKLGPSFIQRDRNSAEITIPPQKIQYYEIDGFNKVNYPEQYRAYRELQDQYMIYSGNFPDEVRTVDIPIVHITRSRQMMTWPNGIEWRDSITNRVVFNCDVTESIKIDKAVELAKELIEEGERVVLFSQFTAPLEELCRRLSNTPVETEGDRSIRPVLLYGGTNQNRRDEIRFDFDAKNKDKEGYDRWDIVLANYKVAGVSLTLTKASQMIVLDEAWTPGGNDQAAGRIDRIGQTKQTTVHVLQVADTIDTWMRGIVKMKEDIIEGFEVELNLTSELRKGIQDGNI